MDNSALVSLFQTFTDLFSRLLVVADFMFMMSSSTYVGFYKLHYNYSMSDYNTFDSIYFR